MQNPTKNSSQETDNKEHDALFLAKRITDVGSDDQVLIDKTTTAGTIYIGRAARGAATSDTGWVLLKIVTTSTPMSFTHAVDSWGNYLTAIYS